jgi:male germ cell-associated kinase
MTEYVATRWYRAPELVLKSRSYSSQVDIFALGAIMAEMFLGRPIFPGHTETDQLMAIVSVLGTTSNSQWPEGYRLSQQNGIKFPQIGQSTLTSMLEEKNVSADGIDLIKKMLMYNPQNRITA